MVVSDPELIAPSLLRRALATSGVLAVVAALVAYFGRRDDPGRRPQGAFKVVVRRPGGTPAVIENEPVLPDGRPMPTRWWLVDPDLNRSVGTIEAEGGVRQAEDEVGVDAMAVAHSRYEALRDAAMPAGHGGPRPSGGVGGTRRGGKCLHAHLAWWLAGGEDPTGAWVARRLVERGRSVELIGPSGPVGWPEPMEGER